MLVAALLPLNLLEHLRQVLRGAHVLESAADVARLDALLRSAPYDLLIIDPSIQSGQAVTEIEALLLRHREPTVVLYTSLAPSAVRAAIYMVRSGVQHMVLHRYDDEPRRFLEFLERLPVHPMAELMLKELAVPLAGLPVPVTRAIEQVVRSPSLATNVDDLARLAGMASRSLYRHLNPVGLAPRQLIVCARLLRAYAMLREPGSRLKEITAKLGYADPDTLSYQLHQWTGHPARDIRKNVSPVEFVRLLGAHMRQAGPMEEVIEVG